MDRDTKDTLLGHYLDHVEKKYLVCRLEFFSKKGQSHFSWLQKVTMFLCVEVWGFSHEETAELFGRSTKRLGNIVRSIRAHIKCSRIDEEHQKTLKNAERFAQALKRKFL